MHPRSITRAGLLVLAAAGSGPALAIALATVDARSSVTYVSYRGGFAIAGDSGEAGSLVPIEGLTPAELALEGSHIYSGRYLSWDVTYTVDWALLQAFMVDTGAQQIRGQGSVHLLESSAVVGPNCNPCGATVSIGGTNSQHVEFSLSESTAYNFHSDNTVGQWIDLKLWYEPTQNWLPLWLGAIVNQGQAFDRSGVLAAGRYQLTNNPNTFVADGSPPSHDNAWNYSLTLPGAVVSQVPEPASALLLAAGLVALRRARGVRHSR